MGQFEVLKKIQEIELDALKEFNKICKENNLMFFLRGGSVMGAVKYQGFIPWDDDVDIAVPREDYDQLPQIFENKIIAGKYQVLCHQYCEELHCYFPRLFLLEDERIRDLLDIKVYVDTDADIRILRRLVRDINERGRTIESVVDQYLNIVRPMHLQFTEPSKKYADIIIPEGGHNYVAIDLLMAKIRDILK